MYEKNIQATSASVKLAIWVSVLIDRIITDFKKLTSKAWFKTCPHQ